MIINLIKFALTASATVAFNSYAFAEVKAETRQPIKMAQLNLPEADFITYTLGKILEKAGYKVEYVKADYTAHFTAIELDDLDVAPTAWTNTPELIDAAVKTGNVENVGSNGLKVQEGWWYPSYVEKVCPGLPDWKALKNPDCIKALSRAEAPGKIHYIGTPADWAAHDEERVDALGLQFDIIPSGTQPALIAAMEGAIDRKEPVLGYGLSPHWLFDRADGKFVDLPAYDPACGTDPKWGINPDKAWDCGLQKGTVDKLINVKAKARAPGAYKILKRYMIDNATVGQATYKAEKEGKDIKDLADQWVSQNSAIWSEWLK